MKNLKKTVAFVFVSSLFSFSAQAELIPVLSGVMDDFTCSSVMNGPLPDQESEVNDFSDNYYDAMNYTIYRDDKFNYYMTTALYAGMFNDVSKEQNKFNFVQVYGDGSDVAVISMNGRKVTYSNNGSAISRLCKAEIIFRKNLEKK
jgi:hypothetical protein